MSGKIGRPVDPEKNRVILQAARELLFSCGPQALTMDAVAKRAGVSKATLYNRYANRLALLQVVIDCEAFDIHKPLQTVPVNREDLCRDLVEFVDALVAFLCGRHHRRFMQALSELPQRSRDLAEIYRNGPEKTHRVLSAYLQEAAMRGLIRCPHPQESAETLLGLAMGLDLVRSQYRVPLGRQKEVARKSHARQMVSAFMILSAGVEP